MCTQPCGSSGSSGAAMTSSGHVVDKWLLQLTLLLLLLGPLLLLMLLLLLSLRLLHNEGVMNT